jgi:hypothetical protein
VRHPKKKAALSDGCNIRHGWRQISTGKGDVYHMRIKSGTFCKGLVSIDYEFFFMLFKKPMIVKPL